MEIQTSTFSVIYLCILIKDNTIIVNNIPIRLSKYGGNDDLKIIVIYINVFKFYNL